MTWFESLSLKDKNYLNQIVKWASKIIGESQPNLSGLYSNQLQYKVSAVIRDCYHPLPAEFQVLHTGSWFVAPRWRTKQYMNTSVTAAIELMNKNSSIWYYLLCFWEWGCVKVHFHNF